MNRVFKVRALEKATITGECADDLAETPSLYRTKSEEEQKMKYNLSKLMKKAWSLFRTAAKKAAITFSEALRKAWAWLKVQAANAEIVRAAIEAAGIEEEAHTWAGWQSLGRMVIHTEEAILKVNVADPTTKNGRRVKSYFTYSQTQPTPVA